MFVVLHIMTFASIKSAIGSKGNGIFRPEHRKELHETKIDALKKIFGQQVSV